MLRIIKLQIKRIGLVILSAVFVLAITLVICLKYCSETPKLTLNTYIEFLSIDNHLADSILQTLSDDERIDLLIRGRYDENLQFTNQSSILSINSYHYLQSIKDSIFIEKYLKHLVDSKKSGNFAIKLGKHEYENTQDSIFVNFIVNRYQSYKSVLNDKGNLLCLDIEYNNLIKLYSELMKSGSFASKLYEEISRRTDMLIVDSIGQFSDSIAISGIIALNTNDSLLFDKQIIKLVNGKCDMICTSPNNVEALKNMLSRIIAKDSNAFDKMKPQLIKLLKAKLWQQNKKAKATEQDTVRIIAGKYIMNEQYLTEKAICLLNNKDSIIPLSNHIYNSKLTVAYFGDKPNMDFINNVKHYIKPKLIHVRNEKQVKLLKSEKNNYVIFIIDTLLSDSILSKNLELLLSGRSPKNSIIVNIRNHDNLKLIPDSFACVQTPGNRDNDYRYAAQSVFGGLPLKGQLAFNISDKYKLGDGYESPKTRLKYAFSEDARANFIIQIIEKIVIEGIARGAFPGCQIFVAKNGKVLLNKSFGYHTYARKQAVMPDDIYDLASVTKIAATTIATMKMQSDKKLDVSNMLALFFDDTHINYTRIKPDTLIKIDTLLRSSITNWTKFLKQNDTTNINDSMFMTIDTVITKLTPKQNIFKVRLVDLLRHKSGISPAVPVFRYMYYKTYFLSTLKKQDFYKQLRYKAFYLSNNFPKNQKLNDSIKNIIQSGFDSIHNKYFSKKFIKDTSEIQLCNNLYFTKEYFDTLWRDIKQMPVYSRKITQYSDLNMVLLQMAIDSLNKKTIDYYLKKNIYKSMGLNHITYLPLKHYNKNKIIPTELAEDWRHGLLKGFVHDPSAAFLGGISGNAGLFANANDLGVLFQMLLNNGKYGGSQFIKQSVIKQFTKREDGAIRALGFDMPSRKSIISSKASRNSYGHTGYTGTCVWVDPDNQIVYVFLSNRNHPTSKNWKIVNHKIRERIHDAIYEQVN